MKTISALSLCLSVAAVAFPASASITSVGGLVTQIGAPPSALPGALSSFNAWAWDEQQNLLLPPVPVDLSTNPSNSGAPVAGVLAGLVDSHFIHLDGQPGAFITGTVTFSGAILGVQYGDANLDLTDALASTGTLYPTLTPLRGFNNWTGADFISINANVLTFQFSTISPAVNLEEVRVFTRAVPSPGAAALVGMGGLMIVRRRRAKRA